MGLLNIVIFLVAILGGGIYAADLRCWEVTKDMHYSGLEKVPFNDLDSCIAHCLGLPQCSTVDWDVFTKPPCWVQKKIFEPTKAELKPQNGVTNYMLDRDCKGLTPAVDIKCWSVSPKKHYTDLGLDEVPIKDLFSCLNYCISLPQCGTIDFDTGTKNPCWVQLKTYEVKTSALKPKDSATNYILNRSCLKPQNAFGISKYFQCWKATPGKHYSGLGLGSTPLDDLTACASLCLSLPQCTTIDIDTSTKGKCWVQKKSFEYNVKDLKPRATVTNYALDRNCYDKLVKEDLDCWIVTPKHHYSDQGLVKTSYNDLGSCLGLCDATPQCFSFDIDQKTNGKCWLQLGYFEATLKALKPKDSVTNYFYDKNCQLGSKLTSESSMSKLMSCWLTRNDTAYAFQEALKAVSQKSLKECLFYCYSLPGCKLVSYEWSSGSPCKVLVSDKDVPFDNFKFQTGVSSFIYNKECSASYTHVQTSSSKATSTGDTVEISHTVTIEYDE